MMVRDPAEKVNPKVPAALSPEWLLLRASPGEKPECVVVFNAGLEAVNGAPGECANIIKSAMGPQDHERNHTVRCRHDSVLLLIE